MHSFYTRLITPPAILPSAGRAANRRGKKPPRWVSTFRLFLIVVFELASFLNSFWWRFILLFNLGLNFAVRIFLTWDDKCRMNLLFAISIALQRFEGDNFFKRWRGWADICAGGNAWCSLTRGRVPGWLTFTVTPIGRDARRHANPLAEDVWWWAHTS